MSILADRQQRITYSIVNEILLWSHQKEDIGIKFIGLDLSLTYPQCQQLKLHKVGAKSYHSALIAFWIFYAMRK